MDIPTPYNGALEAASIPRITDIVAVARAIVGLKEKAAA
jgi:hypothetical protein